MRIGEVSKKLELPISTIRYYDEIGLIHPKRMNDMRDFDEDDFMRLQMIKRLKTLGFSMTEIKALFVLEDTISDRHRLTEDQKNMLLGQVKVIRQKKNQCNETIITMTLLVASFDKMLDKLASLGLVEEDASC